MGEKRENFSISSDESPNRWVDPRRNRRPDNGGGVGDGGSKPTKPLARNPRKKKFLHSDPLVPTAKRSRYFTSLEIEDEEENAPPPWKPVFDISRWGNMRCPFTAAKEAVSPLKTPLDLSRGDPRSPLTAMKSPSSELAGNVGVMPLGDELAGRKEVMGSPAELEVDGSNEGWQPSHEPVSPLSSLVIPSCDKEMWDEAVAEAEIFIQKMFPGYDQ